MVLGNDVRVLFFLLFSCGIFLFLPNVVSAAFLYIDPPSAEVFRGDTVTLGVRIDTDADECINTVDTVIHYDPSIRAVDVSRGDSILSLWVEDPVIDETNHTITFTGGIPGGYCGRIPGDPRLTNVLTELVFRSPGLSVGGGSGPTANVWFDEATQVLLHDGRGTRAPLRTQGSVINLLDSVGPEAEDSWLLRVQDDAVPPADFVIHLSQTENAFGGEYFITFNTVDKQSGVDHYEVMEEPFEDFYLFRWGGADIPWKIVTSPYVLDDQTLNSTIRVKAVDKAGNETIAVLVPDDALRSLTLEKILTVITLVVVASLIIGLGLYALWRRKQKLIETYDNN